MKMLIKCHYCPHQSQNLTEAIRHFEEKHRSKDEYIELEVQKLYQEWVMADQPRSRPIANQVGQSVS